MTRHVTTLASMLALALSLAAMMRTWEIRRPPAAGTDGSPEPAPLLRTIPAVHFERLPLDRAVDQIARDGRVQIDVNWDRLEDYDIDRARTVNVDLRHVSVIGAVETVFDLTRGNNARRQKIEYRVDRNIIHIDRPSGGASWVRPSRPPIVRLYEVRSLLDLSYRPPRPAEKPNDQLANVLFAGAIHPLWTAHFSSDEEEARFDDLSQELASACDIEPGNIGFWAGRMVVIADQKHQTALQRVLTQMRSDERAIEQSEQK